MLAGLMATALMMGLAGGPHCVAMCGAATAGIGCTPSRLWAFQAGRIAGYALMGGLAASSAGLLQWSAAHAVVLKPFWAMFHMAVVALGVSLLWQGRQPAWIDRWGHRVWQRVRLCTLGWDQRHGPAAAGLLWALLPCGLLYSALMVASLGAQPWQGAIVMAGFAAGSALSLHLGPALWLRLQGSGGARAGHWGVRLAGLSVATASAWALGHGLWIEYGQFLCA